MKTYECPLCHQPVSISLYNQITGIWAERKKKMAQIKIKEAKLKKDKKDLLNKMKEQQIRLKKQSEKTKQIALKKADGQFKRKLKILKTKSSKIEEKAQKKIEKAIRIAHQKAQKEALASLYTFKKQSKIEIKTKVKEEKRKTQEEAKQRYRKWQISLESATKRISTMSVESKEQRARIKELEEQIKKQTTPQIEGLLYEITLIKELKKHFRNDVFDHEGKKGDVVHHILDKHNVEIGKIVYECKRVKKYDKKFITQAFEAKQIRKADFAILVTTVMKPKTQGFFAEKGVLIVHPAGVISLVSILRDQIIKIAQMKLGQEARDKAIKHTLKYLQSSEFSNSIEAITEEAINSYKELAIEVRKHLDGWKRRYGYYTKIYTEAIKVKDATATALSGQVEKKRVEEANFPQLQETTVELPLESTKEEKHKED